MMPHRTLVGDLDRASLTDHESRGMPDPRPLDGECCLAVIGLACRLPGAGDETAYWSDLAAGRSRLTSLSGNELEAHGTGPGDRSDPRVIRSFGVLDGVDRFDADFFGIPPRRAARLDPQQRILLEMAWQAMEQAGQAPGDPEQVVGTFVALTSSGYVPAAAAGDEDAVFDLTSAEKDYAATRIAHKLGLTGPAVVVQSACSSALLAVHTACEALLGGQCDLAIAGGISIALPQGAYRHVPGLMLSPTGACRVFDAAADGTVPGNGGGLVVLKPLARALADGDPIRAVIRGSAANNDGAVKADYLAPSVQGQALAVGEALTVAGLDPADIGLIEAHATGTRLGDPIEIEALSRVFAGVPAGTIAVGSAKASIGHLNVASGIAGLVKAILALENATIPPVPGFAAPNPEIAFDGSPFYVPFAARPWPPPERGRRTAGVSSFGFGGTNVHVVLEEAPLPASRPACGPGPFPLLLSALDGARLEAAALALADALEADPAIRLDDVAWTLLAGRKPMPARRAAMVRDRDRAIAWLRGAASDALLPDPIDAWLRGGALRPASLAARRRASRPAARHPVRAAAPLDGAVGAERRADRYRLDGRREFASSAGAEATVAPRGAGRRRPDRRRPGACGGRDGRSARAPRHRHRHRGASRRLRPGLAADRRRHQSPQGGLPGASRHRAVRAAEPRQPGAAPAGSVSGARRGAGRAESRDRRSRQRRLRPGRGHRHGRPLSGCPGSRRLLAKSPGRSRIHR